MRRLTLPLAGRVANGVSGAGVKNVIHTNAYFEV